MRALAGDINAVLPVAAPVTVKVWSEHAEAAILGRLRFTVAWRIVVPLPPPDGVCQVAFPVASEARSLPPPGLQLVIVNLAELPPEVRLSSHYSGTVLPVPILHAFTVVSH